MDLENLSLDELVIKLNEWNESYRIGKPTVSDEIYDKGVDILKSIDPYNEFLYRIGHIVLDEKRKAKLPIEMASMDKLKDIDEVLSWVKEKGLDNNSELLIEPKLDGIAQCVHDIRNEAFTRGDGTYGQESYSWYELLGNKSDTKLNFYTYGEAIMSKSIFNEKYSDRYANPRNLVAGLFNQDEPSEALRDVVYIKYGANINPSELNISKKSELLDILNNSQPIKINYHIIKLKDLNHDNLIEIFNEFNKEYEIDGLIIEINDLSIQNSLGRERNNNPSWARAYKSPDFEEKIETVVENITYEISKHGLMKPVLNIKPVHLNGVIISNVSAYNARYLKDNELGVGSIIKIVRSGGVIPKVHEVIEPTGFKQPKYVIDNEYNIKVEIKWNENGVELMTVGETPTQTIKKIVSFFEIMGAKNISIGTIKLLYSNGFKTLRDILNLKLKDLNNIKGIGDRKAEIIIESIKKSLVNKSLPKIQHACNIFIAGEKKLNLLEHFDTKPTLEEVLMIDGIGVVLANDYIENYDVFFEFLSTLPITPKERTKASSNDLEKYIFVFTGFRDDRAKELIESKSGKVSDSISSKTTHLVCKDKSKTSSKLEKARKLGVEIINIEELYNIIK